MKHWARLVLRDTQTLIGTLPETELPFTGDVPVAANAAEFKKKTKLNPRTLLITPLYINPPFDHF
jgi:hypothetical protein